MSVASVLRSYSTDLLNELLLHATSEERAQLTSILEAEDQDELNRLCAQETASFNSGPLLWLTKHTCTENPKAAQQGLPFKHPFPQKSYFIELFKTFLGIEPYGFPEPTKPRLFIPKTREMLTSWAAMGYATWRAQWHRWEVLVQTESEDKATELVEYAAQLHRNQDQGLLARHPLSAQSLTEMQWKDGGRVKAIPKGANKVRLYHPTLYVMDEAAFLPEAQACYDNAHPVAFQIIAISSADDGWFMDECEKPLTEV